MCSNRHRTHRMVRLAGMLVVVAVAATCADPDEPRSSTLDAGPDALVDDASDAEGDPVTDAVHDDANDADVVNDIMQTRDSADDDVPIPPMACNGHVALCDRPFDEVVFAGTHNSMASDEDVFIAPNQTWSIPRQLDDGIRAMLIDTYRDDDGLALCHGSCLFGRLDAIDELREVTDFLQTNPHEVMAFIFQDGISMDDSVMLLESTGLAALAITPPAPGATWPSLGELIAADTRVLLTHESGASGPAWFPRAWDVFVDTPYSFDSVDAFDCRQNRGPADAPLRLLNHWLGAPLPLPSLAEEANRSDILRSRADTCTEEWGRVPTIIAVDFYEIGALFEVVDELNGVDDGG